MVMGSDGEIPKFPESESDPADPGVGVGTVRIRIRTDPDSTNPKRGQKEPQFCMVFLA